MLSALSSSSSYSSLYGSSSSAAKASSGDTAVLIVFLLILVIAAWLWSIALFAQESRRKGHYETGKLWFIGIFATPIVVGIYTAQLPDLKAGNVNGMSQQERKAIEAEEFPEL